MSLNAVKSAHNLTLVNRVSLKKFCIALAYQVGFLEQVILITTNQ